LRRGSPCPFEMILARERDGRPPPRETLMRERIPSRTMGTPGGDEQANHSVRHALDRMRTLEEFEKVCVAEAVLLARLGALPVGEQSQREGSQ